MRSAAQGKPEGFPESMGGWGMYETDWYKSRGGETPEEILVVSHADPIMMHLRKTEPFIQMGQYITNSCQMGTDSL